MYNITKSEIKLRIISAFVLLGIFSAAFYSGRQYFFLFIAIIASIACLELYKMTRNAFYTISLSLAFVMLPTISMVYLYLQNKNIFLWLVLVVCITDIIAYFVGRKVRGKKLSSNISPQKTWSGFLGGILAGALIGLFSGEILVPTPLMFGSGLIALAAQFGDLLESYLKRVFSVKDSGKIIPGHGGVLDRIDGFIINAPLTALTVFILKI